MTTVGDILAYLETLSPRGMKMEWDNVGLLCGSRSAPVDRVLVALDPFEHVCREAAELGAQLILTHHPLIFAAPKAVTDETSVGRSIQLLCRHGISAINAHTNLDQAPGGVNDVLAATLGLGEVSVLNPQGADSQGNPWGLLRAGYVNQMALEAFLPLVKERLNCAGLRYVSGDRPVRHVAVGGGACAGELPAVASAGCDTFVTSDVRYNQFWDAKDLGINLIDAGHFPTENPVVEVLASKVREAFPELKVTISRTHRDCMKFFTMG